VVARAIADAHPARARTTARRDLGEKLRLYAEVGVLEYWIVDPGPGTFEFLERDGEAFRVRLPESGTYRSALIEGLDPDVEGFWGALST
jgi:Uma2 family endonuclease